MEIFKITNVTATRASEFDPTIEALFEGYDRDGSNIIALKQDKEGSAQGLVQRLKGTYQDLLDERNLVVRLLGVSIRQKELKDAGYTKMVVLAPKDTTEAPVEVQVETPDAAPTTPEELWKNQAY